ncbi:MAG: hypothetical protein IKS95_03625, partial [Verrucomicrobia bacterium]|nr:hypothetical protein [Verrucomicrobiota bacterium]
MVYGKLEESVDSSGRFLSSYFGQSDCHIAIGHLWLHGRDFLVVPRSLCCFGISFIIAGIHHRDHTALQKAPGNSKFYFFRNFYSLFFLFRLIFHT